MSPRGRQGAATLDTMVVATMSLRFASLTPPDQPAIVDHLLGLEGEDRVLRFNATLPDGKVAEYAARWNFANDIVEGAWDGDRLVGIIHLPVFRVGPDLVAELGVSVDARWRKRGIATVLADRVVEASRERGVGRIYINFLTRNRPMHCLSRRFTDDIEQDGDETVAKIRIAARPKVATPALEPAGAAPAGSTA